MKFAQISTIPSLSCCFSYSLALLLPLPLPLFLSLCLSCAVQFIRAVQPRLCNCKFLLISLSTPRCHCQLRIAYCKSQRSLIKLHTLSSPSSADAEDCRLKSGDCLKNWNSSRNRCKQAGRQHNEPQLMGVTFGRGLVGVGDGVEVGSQQGCIFAELSDAFGLLLRAHPVWSFILSNLI